MKVSFFQCEVRVLCFVNKLKSSRLLVLKFRTADKTTDETISIVRAEREYTYRSNGDG